ncbi:MAG TPA: GntR family transcriptional regulator [Limnochordales bacterium]
MLQVEHARAIPISSRAELVYEALRDDIFNNRLRPGERVSEERIAQRLKVSRTPVREALKRLHAEGLVEITPHRGAVVRDPSGEELAELCTVREVLEGLAARLAARSISDVELYTLERLINEMDAAAREDRIDDLIQYNHQFHESIWLATRNRYLARQLRQLRQFIFRLQESSMRFPGRKEEAQAEHRALYKAIAEGSPDEAERIAREHFRRGEAIRMLLWRKERLM